MKEKQQTEKPILDEAELIDLVKFKISIINILKI